MARDDPMMRFRAPTELKTRIEEAASKNGRSLNAEIVHRLEESFEMMPAGGVSALYDAPLSPEGSYINIVFACDALEYAEEVYRATSADPASSDLDIALCKHDLAKTRNHFEILAKRAKRELPKEKFDKLPAYVLKRISAFFS